jgi:cardiolipin synthase
MSGKAKEPKRLQGGGLVQKLVKLLFHRAGIVALALLAQLALLVVMMAGFSQYFKYFYLVCLLISVFVLFWILGNRSDPAYKIAWSVPILIFPVFGGVLYLLMGGMRLSRRTKAAMRHMEEKMTQVLAPDFGAEDLWPHGKDAVNQARYLENVAKCPAYGHTETAYFGTGEAFYSRMLEELRKAKRYIFLEYFIIEAGEMWNGVLDILKEKVREGVDIRLIYDDLGSIFTLPAEYWKEMEALGIRCKVFNPFVPIFSLRLNNRDHRKLCIIDGMVGFTGGINLADEYINRKVRFGHWKDSGLLARGAAVWSMTVMFLSTWDHLSGEEEDFDSYRPPAVDIRTQGYVQPYLDTPLDDEPVGQSVYLNMVCRAKDYLYVTTPYLIVNHAMNAALCNAAQSGVDVRIITPHIPDKKTVFEVTRAHYPPLLEAGVRIYEYTPGFIHAKNMVSDDVVATVGTINLDYRSFFLHFEDGVWMCGTPSIRDIKVDFLQTLEVCEEMTTEMLQEEHRSMGFLKQMWRGLLRVFAPLM